MLACQQLHQHVLRAIGVLIFVDEQMLKARVQLGADVVVLFQQFHVLADEVIEVHGVEFAQPLLIQLVNLRDTRAEEVEIRLFIRRRIDQLILRMRDPRQHRARRKCFVVHLQLTHAAAHQRELIGGVVDDE